MWKIKIIYENNGVFICRIFLKWQFHFNYMLRTFTQVRLLVFSVHFGTRYRAQVVRVLMPGIGPIPILGIGPASIGIGPIPSIGIGFIL